jgi:uncharacterized protein (TIGR02996 family)
MNDEQALLAAIVAHPGEDTPRLAYADWLDEHEAPLQADFIRTQCALATCSANAPSYPDVVERAAESAVRFGPLAKMTVPALPEGFAFNSGEDAEPNLFHRGFPYVVECTGSVWYTITPDDRIDTICDGLSKLIATTTARALVLEAMTPDDFARILSAPGADAITELTVLPSDWTAAGGDDALRVLAGASAVAPGLERLDLRLRGTAGGLAALAGAKLDRLTHLVLPAFEGPVGDLRPVLAAKWLPGLRSAHLSGSDPRLESTVLTALASLPRLESLGARILYGISARAFGSARAFPSLARLELWLNIAEPERAVATLMSARLPQLAELDLHVVRSAYLAALLKARWFPQLRVLSLRRGQLSAKVLAALAKSPAAGHLRILRLEGVELGNAALAVLANGKRFPSLTTLELSPNSTRKVTAAQLVNFAQGLSLPRLRHLKLSGWQLGDAGAAALAANPALATLTRLSVAQCRIGEKGLTALVRSPHLQGLIELDASGNKLKTAAALRDTRRLPHLAAARLADNALSEDMFRRLQKARGLAV